MTQHVNTRSTHVKEPSMPVLESKIIQINEKTTELNTATVTLEPHFTVEEAMKTKNKVLVLSDVDGTLLKGSLVLNHACELHEKGLIDLGDAPQKWLDDKKNETLMADLAEKYRAAIIGKSEKDINVNKFIKKISNDTNNFYSSITELQWMKNNGADVILISGSPQYLVKELAKNFGFKGIGSNYHVDKKGLFTGGVDGMFFAEAKRKTVKNILNKHALNTVIHAYGDTASDIPLFEVATQKVLVDPNPETLQKISELPDARNYRIVTE